MNSEIISGSNFLRSKKEVIALVDTCNFFFVGHDLGHTQEALEICQKSTNLENIKVGQICCCQKVGHESQLMPVTFLEGSLIRACTN